MDVNLYFLNEGTVSVVDDVDVKKFDEKADWKSSILVIARDESEALEAADLYDRGLIDGDNHYWPDAHGKLIKCIHYRQFKDA